MAISTTVDQVLSSASNALVVFVLAQVSSAGQFGIIGLLISVLAFCITFDRGALGTPLLLTSNLTNRQIVAESNYALTWSLYTGAVGGFLILTLGAVCHHPWIGLAFAVALPVVLAQDVLRLTAIALSRPGLAVVADALWAAPILGIFVANLFGVRESAEFSLYLWALSGLVSAGILAFQLGIAPQYSRILDWWRTDWPARLRFGIAVGAVGQIGGIFVTLATVTTAGHAHVVAALVQQRGPPDHEPVRAVLEDRHPFGPSASRSARRTCRRCRRSAPRTGAPGPRRPR